VFSRLLRGGRVTVPKDDSQIQLGDALRLVGPRTKILEFEPVIGRKSSIDIKSVPSELRTEHLYVTKREVLGKSEDKVYIELVYVSVEKNVTRADVEFEDNNRCGAQFEIFSSSSDQTRSDEVNGDLVGNKPVHWTNAFCRFLSGFYLG
jgi:putative transport protein